MLPLNFGVLSFDNLVSASEELHGVKELFTVLLIAGFSKKKFCPLLSKFHLFLSPCPLIQVHSSFVHGIP